MTSCLILGPSVHPPDQPQITQYKQLVIFFNACFINTHHFQFSVGPAAIKDGDKVYRNGVVEVDF